MAGHEANQVRKKVQNMKVEALAHPPTMAVAGNVPPEQAAKVVQGQRINQHITSNIKHEGSTVVRASTLSVVNWSYSSAVSNWRFKGS